MGFKIPDTPEELLNHGRRRFSEFIKWIPQIFALTVLSGFMLSSFYSVGPDEVGVIRRFGQYHRTTAPGLHWKFPFNIERLDIVKVTTVFLEEFGFRTVKAGVSTQYSSKSFLDESLMLTGDLNVLDVTWVVQFKIKDPVKLLFNIRDPRQTVRDISEAVMRQEIGDSSVNEALATRRIELNLDVQDRIQTILDKYESGIQIENVKLQDVNPPDEVKPSFNEVNEAKQEQEKVVNQSWEAYNKVIPKARGEAEKTIREAEGYALRQINQAQGDAANFLARWNEYKKAKEVTRQRLYLETLEEVLPTANHIYIMDADMKSFLPLLNLKEGTGNE